MSTTRSAEPQLARALADMRDRIGGDASFAVELYRGLSNRVWHRGDDAEVSVSWRRAEELINAERDAAGRLRLDLVGTGDEGELADHVRDELGRRGWWSEPLDTGDHHEPHATSPESPPPPDQGKRLAPTQPSHESGTKLGRDPQERARPSS